MKRYFCTLFDKNYLIKGLTMIISLREYCNNFCIYVLCLDNKTKNLIEKMKIKEIECIPLKEVENYDLLSVKRDRSNAEYCWTLASSFTWFIMQNYPNIDLITYLDADLLFYSSVYPIFEEIGSSSIAIIEHKFSPPFKYLEINGRFCVEWNTFRRDKEGMNCLDKWRQQCLEWCYYKNEEGKMGDQKYLDEWPSSYDKCHIIQHLGAGIAPWNYSQYKITKIDDFIRINNKDLIFYHFHQFQLLKNNKFFRLGKIYTSQKKEPISIYEIYEKKLLETLKIIREIDISFNDGILKQKNFFNEKIKSLIPIKIKNIIRRFF